MRLNGLLVGLACGLGVLITGRWENVLRTLLDARDCWFVHFVETV